MIALEHRAIAPGESHEAGRALLEDMYCRYVGGDMPPVLTASRGKPYFAYGQHHFSISHTRHHVFCALSDRPIGIDAEEQDRSIDLRLADKILSPLERTQYDAAEDKRLALLKFWVLKEASGKQTGFGITANPNRTAFSLDDPRVSIAEGCLLAVVESAECQMPNAE